ncbi:TIGR02757 family protein [bacterium]|nr:TIGR02757 family protein [bacterium]
MKQPDWDPKGPGTLVAALEQLVQQFQADYLDRDPLELVRQFRDARDQEIAAFIAAALAVGQADLIRRAVGGILEAMRPSPFRFVSVFEPERDRMCFHGFRYRFYGENDIGLLLWWTAQIIRRSGSIRAFFLEGYEPSDPDIGPSLSRFVQAVLALESRPFYTETPAKGTGIRHFFADPADGSACKRLNLFLRWMVRKDGLDLGLWPEIRKSQLIIPLDVHITRFGRYLGLSDRKSPDWKMAGDITDTLRRFDPDDPVKYDFALCTLGKLSDCRDAQESGKCSVCPVFRFCRAV